jgi:hypothetical protein
MPSWMVSLDDIEAFCYSEFHCRDPRTIRRFLSMLQVWSIHQSRKNASLYQEIQEDAHPGLLPGETDTALGVRCCINCRIPKVLTSFRPEGSVMCRACVQKKNRKEREAQGEQFPCRKCHEVFPLTGFPEEDTAKTCLRCLHRGGYLGKKIYWKCPACRQMRPSAEFPVLKWRNPRRSVNCLACEDA